MPNYDERVATPYLPSVDQAWSDYLDSVSGYPNSIKTIRKVRPHFNGMTAGTNVTFSIGSQVQPDGVVTWNDSTFTVGNDEEIWPYVRGRYLAWKASMTANDAMEIESLEFDVVKNGMY